MMIEYINIARPKTLIAIIAPLSVLLLKNRLWEMGLIWWCLCVIFGMTIQILTNVFNDYIDGLNGADMHRGAERSNGHQDKKIFRMVNILLILSVILSFLFCFKSVYYVPLCFVCIGLSYLYTGSKYSLAYNGIAEPFALFFFGPVPYLGCLSFYYHSYDAQDILVSMILGLLASSLVFANNMRDKFFDVKVNKNTLAVKLKDKAFIFQIANLVVLIVFQFIHYGSSISFFILALFASFMIFRLLKKQNDLFKLALMNYMLNFILVSFKYAYILL